MKIIYVANDGREFDSYEECAAHEAYCEKLPPSMKWYDKTGKELKPQSAKEIDKMYNDLDVLEILDVDGWYSDLVHMIEFFGFFELNMTPGRYKYIWELYPTQDFDEDYINTHEFYGNYDWVRLREDEF